ncbi:MAG: basic amino acid ABC transporter substrate-binding protein [Cyanobacteria bacterium CRU_2_1]|nr:basic amino acid ABC transporter substrate-binding protein [Cyanobacteria bacterium CRU_2_1]
MAEFKIKRSQFIKRFCVGLGTAVFLFACSNSITEDPAPSSGAASDTTTTLLVATDPTFPPFEFQANGGDLTGFDVELMQAIGEAGGFEVEFQSLPFDGIVPALQAKTVDAAIAAMTITPERKQTVAFTNPYFKAGLAIAVQSDNTEINSLDDLQGKRIAVQIGTTGAEQASEISNADVRTFDSAPLALQELANGNVDAVINDAPVTLEAIKNENIQGLKVVGQLVTEEFYGIALPKNSEHLDEINASLQQVIADGTYAEIYRKWFGAEPPQF